MNDTSRTGMTAAVRVRRRRALRSTRGPRGRLRSQSWWGKGASRGLCDRDYDPTTGTFLTPDPLTQGPDSPQLTTGIGYEDGQTTVANPYHYVGNDPINFVDPLGLCRAHDGVFLAEYEIYGETAPACLGHSEKQCLGESGDAHSHDETTAVVTSMLGSCYAEGWEMTCRMAAIIDICDDAQPFANYAGGMLNVNPLFGLLDLIDRPFFGTELDPVHGGVDSSSGWYTFGNAAGVATDVFVGAGVTRIGGQIFRYPKAGGGGVAITQAGRQVVRADIHRVTVRESFRLVPQSWVRTQRWLPHLHFGGSGRHWPFQTLRAK